MTGMAALPLLTQPAAADDAVADLIKRSAESNAALMRSLGVLDAHAFGLQVAQEDLPHPRLFGGLSIWRGKVRMKRPRASAGPWGWHREAQTPSR